jgi:hypothetical protein
MFQRYSPANRLRSLLVVVAGDHGRLSARLLRKEMIDDLALQRVAELRAFAVGRDEESGMFLRQQHE